MILQAHDFPNRYLPQVRRRKRTLATLSSLAVVASVCASAYLALPDEPAPTVSSEPVATMAALAEPSASPLGVLTPPAGPVEAEARFVEIPAPLEVPPLPRELAAATPQGREAAAPVAVDLAEVETVRQPVMAEDVAGRALPAIVVPVPVRRPRDLVAAAPAPKAREKAPARQAAAPVAAQPEERSFLARLFSPDLSASTPAAYAALGTQAIDANEGSKVRISPALPPAGGGTAVYDIVARTVTMPNGEKLEAHSGLGKHFDDPRFVNLRMRGSTPPGTYLLKEREAKFHGVRAIRMMPVGGSAAIHGRAGILAHSYLLGPRGDSNGCISFKDYDRFLQAYLRGEVSRIVVVAGG